MRKTSDSRAGRLVLMTSHCAGMVDMVALPLWVGVLVTAYAFEAQQAGGLVTLFLLGAVVASLWVSPRVHCSNGRPAVAAGFALATLCFFLSAQTQRFELLAGLHLVGGLAAGTGLSFTHGAIGRSRNPHRLFGLAGMALGVFAVILLGTAPQFIARLGGQSLFQGLGLTMAVAAVLAAWGFPVSDAESSAARAARQSGQKLPPRVWLGIVGVGAMALVQAMVYSFVERIGANRGFGVGVITAILVVIGVVNMFPSGLAAVLQHRLATAQVLCVGPLVQAVLAVVIASSAVLAPFALAACLFVAVMLFTHTFAFGALARLDATGRVVAATPAMVMIGSAIGPVLGGTLIKLFGYGSLAVAAAVIDAIALFCFWRMTRTSQGPGLGRVGPAL